MCTTFVFRRVFLAIINQKANEVWNKSEARFSFVDFIDFSNVTSLFKHLEGEWLARQILADLAGMTVNDTTNTLTTRIIFGKERKPKLIYTESS